MMLLFSVDDAIVFFDNQLLAERHVLSIGCISLVDKLLDFKCLLPSINNISCQSRVLEKILETISFEQRDWIEKKLSRKRLRGCVKLAL